MTPRYLAGVAYASELHHGHVRKGSGVPYLSHLLSVSALVLENGGDEDQAIAGLLHDGPEDCGGEPVLVEIERRFGPRVAAIVQACTDTVLEPKPPWRDRKEEYLAGVPAKPTDALVVILSDKLHNARSIVRDHEQLGSALWSRFRGGRDGTAWYYRALLVSLAARPDAHRSLVAELTSVVDDLVGRAEADA